LEVSKLPIFHIIYLAVFLSGFASLGYELCWISKAALLIGATPQALSIVVAVFFGGMAAGALLFGIISKRVKNPLLWYGILECAIGLLAAITPLLFKQAGALYALTYHGSVDSQALQLLIRSALVGGLIFPACALMGGTLPLLCQFFINTSRADIRFSAGVLYSVNTAGAFLGCLFSGIWSIQFWGIDATIHFNALLSCSAGAGIMLLTRSIAPPSPLELPPSVTPVITQAASLSSGFRLYGLFFLGGFAALGYELLWVRFLSLLIYNTVYSSIFTLAAVLLGIAAGGLLVSRIQLRPVQDLLVFSAANFLIGLSVLLLMLLPVTSWDWIRESRSVPMQALLCLIVILIPSIASGVSFPLAYRLIVTSNINSGRDFGFLVSVNTIGGIVGSLLIGFYLLPTAGMYATVQILTFISLAIGTTAVFMHTEKMPLVRKELLVVAVATLWLGISLTSGTRLPADFLAPKQAMIEFAEGLSAFVAVVTKGGSKTLEIDRMWQGIDEKGHQILAAHIPMILHQDPQRVLVIGMGTGQTASRFLMYGIKRLDCVDIEKKLPGILQRHFDAAWLNDPRTHIVTDDGRNFTAYTNGSYDVVSIEVGQSFRPHIAAFYTVDFYRDVKKRLSKNGLACQFVPLGFFTEREFRSIVASFLEVFPQSTLWFNKYAECILIGNATRSPQLSTKRLDLLQSNNTVRADLAYSFEERPWLLMNNPDVFAANYLMGQHTLAKLSAGAPLYRDDRPMLEYQAARTTYSRSRFHDLITKNMDSPDTVFAQKLPITSELNILRIRQETVHESLAVKK